MELSVSLFVSFIDSTKKILCFTFGQRSYTTGTFHDIVRSDEFFYMFS